MNIMDEVMKPYEEFCEYLDEVVFKEFKKGDGNVEKEKGE